jgi:SAM-dependent methyltransferase
MGCGFVFTNPRPGKAEIGAYYQSDKYISHSNSSRGLFNRIYKLVRNRAIAKKIGLIRAFSSKKDAFSVLDVGCGTGEFLAGAKRVGWKTTGVEPSTDAAAMAQKNHGLEVHEEAWMEACTETFDAITLWHVLEHVHDLGKRLQQLYRLLSNDGILVIAVPNYTAADAKIFGENWAAWDVPRHLYHFSPDSMKRLLAYHGFEHIVSRPMVFDAYYVSLLSAGYAKSGLAPFKGFMEGMKSNLAAKGNAERYSSVIYLFKKGRGA